MELHCKNPSRSMSVTDIKVTVKEDNTKMQNTGKNDLGSASSLWPVTVCPEISCDEESCLWHRCILKIPQHVIWQADVQKVILAKKSDQPFGFTPKAKQHMEDKDNFYYLVKNVDKSGIAACCGLRTGDLILSVNQIAIQSKDKLKEIDYRKLNCVELQIQHPLALSKTAEKYVPQLAMSMRIPSKFDIPGVRYSQPVSPSTSPSSTYKSDSPYRNEETIPLTVISRSVPRNNLYRLPQIRLFVVGHATCDFVRHFFGNFIHVTAKPCCFHISMKWNANGSVSCGLVESFSYLLENKSERCINIELVCVADDSFFHHCCPWMFTQLTVFVLTFDAKHLAQFPREEVFRLYNLAQTIRAGASVDSRNLFAYGLSSHSISKEEIQTLFYTLPDHYLPNPVLIPTGNEFSVRTIQNFQSDFYQRLSGIVEKQEVSYSTAVALDMLSSHNSFTITCSSLKQLLEERDGELLKHHYQIIEDLIKTGNLIVAGKLNSHCISPSTKEYLLPIKLFKSLSCLAKCMEEYRTSIADQNMNWTLCTTGLASRSALRKLFTAEHEKLISSMEDLQLIIPIERHCEDSGFEDEKANILFPFFLEDVPFELPEGFDRYFTLKASEEVSLHSFYMLVAKLSQLDCCQMFRMVGQFVGHFNIDGVELYLHFQKASREIHGFRSSCQQSHKTSIVGLISQILDKQISDVKFYEPNEQINCPTDFPGIPENIFGPTNIPDSTDVQQLAQNRVLDMKVVELKSVLPALHRIYQLLSIQDAWEHLAGVLGLTIQQIMLYSSLPSNRLPAETFLNSYFHESGCTLRDFLKALLDIEPRFNQCRQLADDLWNTALYNNSDYYRRMNNVFH